MGVAMSNGNHAPWKDTWRRFGVAVQSFHRSPAGKPGLLLFASLIVFLFAINGLNVLNSYVGRDFISSIENRNHTQFVHQTWLFIGVFCLSTVVAVMYRFAEERLSLLWRDWQTRQLLGEYLNQRVYYHLQSVNEIENPDQRIAEDVKTFTTTSLSFTLMILNSSFTIVAFSGVLWSISPRLFAVAVIYALIGTGLTVLVGKKLVGLNNKQLDQEAAFRAELIHVREHAECVALMQWEGAYRKRLFGGLDNLIHNFRRIIAVNRNLGFFSTGYNYFIQILPALLVAPLFIEGKIEFGVVTQSAVAFGQLMGAFSLIVTQFPSISSYTAVIRRLSRLIDSIEDIDGNQEKIVKIEHDGDRIEFQHVTLRRNGDAPLVNDLSIQIPAASRVLVSAVSGYAKIALFQAAAGLSCKGEGKIIRPRPEQMFFLPERPHLFKSTMRDLLRVSPEARNLADDEIREVLRSLHVESLIDLAGGFDVERAWDDLLGLGEQAALAVARVLLADPQFVFLDRMSIAMDSAKSDQILKLFTEKGIGYLVLGRSIDDLGNFDASLSIAADGSWTWNTTVDTSST